MSRRNRWRMPQSLMYDRSWTVGCGWLCWLLAWPLCAQDPLEALRTAIRDQQGVERLEPQPRRDEAVEDHLLASTWFAEGRLQFRRENYDAALQRYQRAYRFSNGSTTILDEIVPLAFRLGRFEQAARYGRLLSDTSQVDPFVLRRLALYLTEQEDYPAALRLYDLAVQHDHAADHAASLITTFEMGRLRYLIEEYEQASRAFDAVLARVERPDPQAADGPAIEALLKEATVTFSLMAEANLLAGRPAEAARLFRRAYEAAEGRALLDFQLARVAQRQQQSAEVERHLGAYLESGDEQAGLAPYELLAELLKQTDRSAQLMPKLQRLREDQPENIFLLYFIGQQELDAKRPAAAIEVFQELIAVRPLLDGYRGLARAYFLQSDFSRLLELLGELATELESFAPLTDLLDELIADDQRLATLVQTARDRLATPDHSLPLATRHGIALAMAKLASHAERAEWVQEFYEAAVKSAADAAVDVRLEWATYLTVMDQSGRAADVLRDALMSKVDVRQEGLINFYLSAALTVNQEYDAALSAARLAARRFRDVPAMQLRPAWVLSVAERWEEADQVYREFLGQYGDQYEAPGARAAVREAKSNLSSLSVQLGRVPDAEEWLDQILDEYPDDVGAMNDLGYLWADRGVRLQRALRMTRAAVEAQPDNQAYRDSHGWALYRLGRHTEAIAELQIAASGDAPDAVILDHLGDAVLQRDGRDAARPYWQRALERLADSDLDRRRLIEAKVHSP